MMATATTTEIITLKQNNPLIDCGRANVQICSLGFKKLANAIHEALELGQQEGFSPKEIGKMIERGNDS